MSDVRLAKASQVKRLMARVTNDLLNNKISEEKARALIYACNSLLGAIERTELEQKVKELEAILKERGLK